MPEWLMAFLRMAQQQQPQGGAFDPTYGLPGSMGATPAGAGGQGDPVLGLFNQQMPGWNRFHTNRYPEMFRGTNRAFQGPMTGDPVLAPPRLPPVTMPSILGVDPGTGAGIPPGGWGARPPLPSLEEILYGRRT